jgi:hypothetical protein
MAGKKNRRKKKAKYRWKSKKASHGRAPGFGR